MDKTEQAVPSTADGPVAEETASNTEETTTGSTETLLKLKGNLTETETRNPVSNSVEEVNDKSNSETALVNGDSVQNGHTDSTEENLEKVIEDQGVEKQIENTETDKEKLIGNSENKKESDLNPENDLKEKDGNDLNEEKCPDRVGNSGDASESNNKDDLASVGTDTAVSVNGAANNVNENNTTASENNGCVNDNNPVTNENTISINEANETETKSGSDLSESKGVVNEETNSIKEPDKVDTVNKVIEEKTDSDDFKDVTKEFNVADNADIENNETLVDKAENNKVEPLAECPNDKSDRKETSCDSDPSEILVIKDNKGSKAKEAADKTDQISGESVDSNGSSSVETPTLVKEVISKNNSVKSEDIQEPMVTEHTETLKTDNSSTAVVEESVKSVTDSNKEDNKVMADKLSTKSEVKSMEIKTGEMCVGTSDLVSFEKKISNVQSSKKEKLDRLLSKITNKAEIDCQKATSTAQPTKQGKARKSFTNSSSLPNKPTPPPPPSLTSLTFNVKELEKKGVLDMPKPKPSKRKAFEPIKIPSPDKEKLNNSPVRKLSPSKSPGKSDNPFFNKQKLLTRRKKKSKRSGGYRLPGEKTWKRNKSKRSEERQLKSETNINSSAISNSHTTVMSVGDSKTPSTVSYVTMTDQKMSPGQTNALDLLTKNSNKSFFSSSANKRAKKTVKGIDPTTNRTLDNFIKTGSHAARKFHDGGLEKNEYITSVDQRKRKASSEKGLPVQSLDGSVVSQDEKKRRTDIVTSPPPQMILVPSGSPPVPIPANAQKLPTTGPGGQQFVLAPGMQTSGQTLIQNGTLNGLPMFQLVNTSTMASPPAQFLIAQSQGRPILTNSSPRATSLLKPGVAPCMPMLLTPVPLSTVHVSQTQSTIKNSIPPVIGNQLLSGATPTPVSAQQQHSVLKNTLAMPRMQLPNGQFIDVKPKEGTIPNGLLYPVTPPRTPEDQRSEVGTQDPSEELEGVTGSVSPDKDIIPLCTCKISGASFQKVTTLVTFCQALDSVDGQVLGCCNKVTNPQLVRPSVKIPFLALCDGHRKRLRLHQCCPGCGHFCTQGKFLQCKKDGSSFIHNFHEQCQVNRNGKNYCPHCGETSHQYEIHLSIPDPKATVPKDSKANRTQAKARIGVLDRRSASSGEETSDEPVVSHVLDKSKKVISTADLPVGPDRHSLDRVLSCMNNERPKKYRHLPKCLYTPAYDNDLERVVYMLEDGHDPNELYDDLEGQSSLHAAAAIGSLCIVHVLIQAGASPHHQDKTLRTPLMFAAENNHADVVRYLINANAIIDAKADDGMTALHLAAKAGHVNIINLLLDTDRLDIDVTDDGGWTPLIWAAEHTEVEAVRVLLQRKSDPNLRDSEENTTMHWAAFSGSVAIAELLLAAGCDLDSLNMHGDRPLHIAARQDHYDLVVVFLARGADVEAKNNKGETPLECCIEQNTAVYLALKVNKQLKSFGAKHMGKPDKLIHRDLSKGRENIPIPCVNGVDEEGEPRDYLYVTDNIETTCLNINRVIGSLQTCQCKDDCSSIYCACGKNSIRCWYDKYNRLVPEFNMLEPPLIFECNRACECWTTCNNRVVQNGVMSRLQVFKTVGRGWGCKTLVDIARGTFICEYIGEHISDSEADRREDDSYLFDLDNRDGETYCIDARRYGNVARFINHLCEPNLTPVKVFVDSQDLRFPRICLFANRDIKAQEELGFDYGEKFWIIKWKQFTCTCGSSKCRYSMETIQKTLEEYRQRHEIDDSDSLE